MCKNREKEKKKEITQFISLHNGLPAGLGEQEPSGRVERRRQRGRQVVGRGDLEREERRYQDTGSRWTRNGQSTCRVVAGWPDGVDGRNSQQSKPGEMKR